MNHLVKKKIAVIRAQRNSLYSESWAGIRFAISSVTVSAQDSVRDLVTRLRKLIF